MIIILKLDVLKDSEEVRQLLAVAARYSGVSVQVREITGATRTLTEVYLIGSTTVVPTEPFAEFEIVGHVVRVSEKYRARSRRSDFSTRA